MFSSVNFHNLLFLKASEKIREKAIKKENQHGVMGHFQIERDKNGRK
jgi:hypothetical protein